MNRSVLLKYLCGIALPGLLFVLLGLSGPLFAAQPDPTLLAELTPEERIWLKAHPEVSVGVDAHWPPVDFTDGQGRQQGITADYLALLQKQTGIKFKRESGENWSHMVQMATHREIDMVADFARNREREKLWRFTKPYYWSPYVIATRREANGIKNIQMLYGKTVAVERGYNLHSRLAKDHPEIRLLPVDNTVQALQAVSREEADAYVGNQTPVFYLIETQRLTNLKVAADSGYPDSQIHFAVRPGWPELVSILNKALRLIPANVSRAIERKWLGLETSVANKNAPSFSRLFLTPQELDWLEAHKPLRVAVMDGWPPFDFLDEHNEPQGIGIDYISAINQRLGEEILVPVPGEWKRIYRDVAEKRLDLILDITPKPEREPLFNFTTPYLTVPHIIVANKNSVYLESEKDLEGKTLALEKGFGNVKYFRKNFPEIKLRLFTNTALALDAVSRGDADAYAGNRVVALYLIEKHVIPNLRIHGRLSKPASALAIGIRKDWPILQNILQKTLDDISKEEQRLIIKRWIHSYNGAEKRLESTLKLSRGERAWLQQHREILIGVDGNWPPIDYTDENGVHSGITADYLRLIGERLGVRFVPQSRPQFKQMLQEVMDGELKVGATISYSDKRAEKLHFTRPFFQVQKVIIVREGSTGIEDLSSLYGRRVAVEDGFLSMRQIQKFHPQIKLVPTSSTLDALKMVSWGKADAYVGNQMVARWLQQQHQLDNLHIIGNAGLGTGPQNFAVTKAAPGWEPLVGILDKVLASITDNERIRIEQRWLGMRGGEELPEIVLSEAERRWLKEHRSIRLGVDADWAPLEFIGDDGKYKGLSSDYMRLFARQLGINWVKPEAIPWTETLAGLRNKTIDLVPMVTRTAERSDYLDFTKPYLELPIVIFTRRGETLLSGMGDLEGKRVAGVEGYSVVDRIKRDYPHLKTALYPSVSNALYALSVGEVDAYVGSLAVGGYLIGREGLSNLQVAASTPYGSHLSIAVREDWPELVNILDKAIESLSETQKNEIYRRWVTVKYEHQIDYSLLWKIVGAILLALIIGGIWLAQIKRTNRALREGRERLTLTLEGARLGSWEVKFDNQRKATISWDRIFADYHGIADPVEGAPFQALHDYLEEEDIPLVSETLATYQKGFSENVTLEYTPRDQKRWLYSHGHSFAWDEKGLPTKIIGIVQDITERKKATDALQQTNRFKSEFLANMSHEIRTPMNAIIGLGHLLSRTALSIKQHDYVHKVQVSARSLLGVIDDILDFSKIEAGRLTIESIPFQLDDVLHNLSILSSTRIGAKPIEFLYDVDPEIPDHLKGDPYRLGQILTNLVANAIKFTEQGSIVVRAVVWERTGTDIWLRFEVEDTGIGISPDKLTSLFEPFTQADGSTTRRFGGTGLGLSICQQLCSLMGGSISAESEPDKGSLFRFELPLLFEKAPVLPVPQPDLRGLKVMLVDDNPMARSVLGDILKSLSFTVSVFGSGKEALVALHEPDAHYDLVLLDWQMPGMDGEELANRIRAELDDNSPLIIMITSYGREAMEQNTGKDVLDGFLVKPLTSSQLFDAIIQAHNSRTADDSTSLPQKERTATVTQLQGGILLVEDNPINMMVAKELLEQMGLSVDTAPDGAEAVSYLEDSTADLILMDIQMPVMDGYEATRRIRSMPKHADMPIYAMTANALVGDAEKSLQAGMNGHIPKPVDPGQLYEILSKHLNQVEVPAEQLATPRPGTSSLPDNMPGIDLQSGLKQVGGNETFYLKLLNDFLINHGNCTGRLKELIAASEFAEARREAHTLKGVGGNIGALQMKNQAAALEEYLSSGERPPDTLFEQFSLECETLFGSLRQIIPASPATGEQEAAESTVDFDAGLEGLYAALRLSEARSTSLYSDLKPQLQQRLTDEQLSEIDRLIDDFEFEEAAALLQGLLEK